MFVWQKRCLGIYLAAHSKQGKSVFRQVPHFRFIDLLLSLGDCVSADLEAVAAERILPDQVPEF